MRSQLLTLENTQPLYKHLQPTLHLFLSMGSKCWVGFEMDLSFELSACLVLIVSLMNLHTASHISKFTSRRSPASGKVTHSKQSTIFWKEYKVAQQKHTASPRHLSLPELSSGHPLLSMIPRCAAIADVPTAWWQSSAELKSWASKRPCDFVSARRVISRET